MHTKFNVNDTEKNETTFSLNGEEDLQSQIKFMLTTNIEAIDLIANKQVKDTNTVSRRYDCTEPINTRNESQMEKSAQQLSFTK